MGMTVFVFAPADIDWQAREVIGHRFHADGRWYTTRCPLPMAVYNRFFGQQVESYRAQARAVRELQRQGVIMINIGLKGKWDVHQALYREKELRTYLPTTILYRGLPTLQHWFQHHDEAFIKPHSGSQGRRTLHVAKEGSSYTVKGRTSANRRIETRIDSVEQLAHWLRPWIGQRKFLVQKYLNLSSMDGTVYDVRVLVQKNGKGLWQTTGMAVREGAAGSSTSNLHGGGSVSPVLPFLKREFGPQAASLLQNELATLADTVPLAVESSFGRFCELGLDFGIDTDGRVWLLEVNSKPGRSVFRKLRQRQERRDSILNPVLYAAYLMERQPHQGVGSDVSGLYAPRSVFSP